METRGICLWEYLLAGGMLTGSLCIPTPGTLKSSGICTQEVLEDLYSLSVSQLCVMRVRGQGWKKGKHPSCISIYWKPSWPLDKGESQAKCMMLKDSKGKKKEKENRWHIL